MSKKLIYLLLAVSLGLNAGVISTTILHRAKKGPPPRPAGPPAGGQHQPGPPPDPARLAEEHVRGITRHLDLTQEQQRSVRAVLERHAPALVEFQLDVAETGRRLTEAFAAPDFDPDQFRQLVEDASAARTRLDSLSAVMLVDEAAVLTPEQRRKFAEVAPSIYSSPQRPPGEGGPQRPPGKGRPPNR